VEAARSPASHSVVLAAVVLDFAMAEIVDFLEEALVVERVVSIARF
jgi:hypothetical protein